tara:strand:- start:475 stop:816 length:342 start_codon:yes stop_codon:yes gene_type:complete
MSQFQESQNTYEFPDTVKGSTLEVQSFEVLINDVPPTSNLSAVVCTFAKDGATTLTPTTAITSAASWQFTIGPVAAATMAIEEGIHIGDIKTTAADGTVKKYCRVVIKILPSP